MRKNEGKRRKMKEDGLGDIRGNTKMGTRDSERKLGKGK